MNDGWAQLDIPDLWQQSAARMLAAGTDVIVDAPTGAGKTRVFELLIDSTRAVRHGQAVFTVPTRALANDKWQEWQTKGWNVGLATGDRTENPDAPILVATLETQRERILSARAPAVLVIDEYQMIADSRRGLNYELAVAMLPLTSRVLLLSGSVRNPEAVADWLSRLGRRVEIVRVRDRPVPLDDFPVEQLPRVPDAIHGFWPRLAVAARMAELTPMLIFAPRRAEAERIARKVAAGLPVRSPLVLETDVDRTVGADLAKLLVRRVAFHHSGLSYHARAGWVEPLAKRGHLDVVVATTGLAAGINFSVRSVFIASTTYFDGPYQRELRPDELLQMFGRAGRRGIDTQGTVLVAPQSPRIFDAAPLQLRRVNPVDWPTLLRVMEEASLRGESPFDAATGLCKRLFSVQSIPLGIEEESSASGPAIDTPDRFDPTREEMMDHAGRWIPAGEFEHHEVPLGETWTFHKDRWRESLRVAAVVEKLGEGRLCKLLKSQGGFVYGKELALGKILQDGTFSPLPLIRKLLKLRGKDQFLSADLATTIIPLLGESFKVGKIVDGSLLVRNGVAVIRLEFSSFRVKAWTGPDGTHLLHPSRRRAVVVNDTDFTRPCGAVIHPPRGSAAYSWRKLGLVDSGGVPTARGRVFSRFQGGEGLMIAAGLEAGDYPIDQMILDLANLRGGYRFADSSSGELDRLAFASREVFGHRDFPGYLTAGICPGYGEGTAAAIQKYASLGMTGVRKENPEIRFGDIERAMLEWLSVLRHIVHAPDPQIPKWPEFQQTAAVQLKKFSASRSDFSTALPARLR